MSVEYDPYSHHCQQDPYPHYRALREEAPVHYVAASDTWVISRYKHVQQVLLDPTVFSSKTDRRGEALVAGGPLTQLRMAFRAMRGLQAMPWAMRRSRMLIQEGGEVHAVMRKLVNRGFTSRRIGLWEKRIRELSREALDRVRGQESFDFVETVAIPLPVTVISEMLGIEPEQRHAFKAWSDAIVENSTGSALGGSGGDALLEAMAALRSYLKPIVRARRAEPAEDLISVLVQTDGEGALSDFEIFLFVLLLLVAGNETTTNLLGNAVDTLLEHPQQLEQVVAEPELIPGLVEETLRFESPVQYLTRKALVDTELSGVRIPAGAHVVVLLASANRDERQFPDGDRFDVRRSTAGHLGFGFGAHFCLGASLARLEACATLEALLPELPGLRRSTPEKEFLDSFLIRGRRRLELVPRAR